MIGQVVRSSPVTRNKITMRLNLFIALRIVPFERHFETKSTVVLHLLLRFINLGQF